MKSFNQFIKEKKHTIEYKVEKAKLDFVLNINKVIKDNNISKSKLADKMGTSKAYVTKILQGDAVNFTIETMVKICTALGGELETRIFLENINSYVDKNSRYEKNTNNEWMKQNHYYNMPSFENTNSTLKVKLTQNQNIHSHNVPMTYPSITDDNWEKSNYAEG